VRIHAVPGQSLRVIRRRGLAAEVRTSEAATVALTGSVGRATARRLRLRRRPTGPVAVAAGTRAVPAGTTRMRIPLTRRARRALRHERRISIRLQARATDAAGNRGTASRRVRVR
jgi:hypothetical protein